MTSCLDCGWDIGHNLKPMCPRQMDLDGIAKRTGEMRAMNDWIARAVKRLRKQGEPWSEIAGALGITKQAAQQRFS